MALIKTSLVGRHAWWVDVLASVLALGVAQAVVFGIVAVMDGNGNDQGLHGIDTVAVFGTTINSGGLSELPPLSIELQGEVSGLYPSAVVDLVMEMTNPTTLDVIVATVSVTVGQPSQMGCPAEALLVGPDRTAAQGIIPVDVILGAEDKTQVAITLALSDTAPSVCQGAVFPLTYRSAGWLPS